MLLFAFMLLVALADAQPDTSWLVGTWTGNEWIGFRPPRLRIPPNIEIVFDKERDVITWALASTDGVKAQGTATLSGLQLRLEGSYTSGRAHARVVYELERDIKNNLLTGHKLDEVATYVLVKKSTSR